MYRGAVSFGLGGLVAGLVLALLIVTRPIAGTFGFLALLAVVSAGIGVALWWFWVWPYEVRERMRLAKLCERCGYDLTANVSGMCPECGMPIRATASARERGRQGHQHQCRVRLPPRPCGRTQREDPGLGRKRRLHRRPVQLRRHARHELRRRGRNRQRRPGDGRLGLRLLAVRSSSPARACRAAA
jgi:hypothetical protein